MEDSQLQLINRETRLNLVKPVTSDFFMPHLSQPNPAAFLGETLLRISGKRAHRAPRGVTNGTSSDAKPPGKRTTSLNLVSHLSKAHAPDIYWENAIYISRSANAWMNGTAFLPRSSITHPKKLGQEPFVSRWTGRFNMYTYSTCNCVNAVVFVFTHWSLKGSQSRSSSLVHCLGGNSPFNWCSGHLCRSPESQITLK